MHFYFDMYANIMKGLKLHLQWFKIFFNYQFCRERKEMWGMVGGERKRERERERDMLFHSFMHLLVASCMCPDQGLNLQP